MRIVVSGRWRACAREVSGGRVSPRPWRRRRMLVGVALAGGVVVVVEVDGGGGGGVRVRVRFEGKSVGVGGRVGGIFFFSLNYVVLFRILNIDEVVE